AVICSKLCFVFTGSALVSYLFRRCHYMMLFHGCNLVFVWSGNYTTTAVKGKVRAGLSNHNYGSININIAYYANIHPNYCSIVTEVSVIPVTTGKACTVVTKTVVNAPIKTDGWAPVT